MRTPGPLRSRSSSDQQAIQVFCRIKPNSTESPPCLEIIDDRTLKSVGTRAGACKETIHTFTGVFDEYASQDHIFEKVALPLVSEFIDGKNGLLLTYGTTGSGKTFAMQGTSNKAGILPLTLDVIFNSLGCRQTKKYVVKPDGLNGFDIQSESDAIMDRHRLDYQQRLRHPRGETPVSVRTRTDTSIAVSIDPNALYAVFVSLVEVYNNNVFDLLREAPVHPGKTPTTHILREDAQRNVYVSGCLEIEVKSTEDALRVFSAGQKRRRVGQTMLNSESSRSHCIFTIRLVRTGYNEKYDEAIEDKSLLVVSQLCLVDLAGSERTARAGTHGERLKEASSINNSLMNLRKCIEVLREIQSHRNGPMGLCTPGGNNRVVVPYRDRRLTHLFKSFFEGTGRVVILVCLKQAVEDYHETLHVLKFAETSQEVSTFRTPTLPPRSPAPSSMKPRYMLPVRFSGNSTDSDDTTFSLNNVDEQLTTLLSELDNYNEEFDRCMQRFVIGHSDLVEYDGDKENDHLYGNLLSDFDDPLEEDSAPEQDQAEKPKKISLTSLLEADWMFDVEPFRALIVRRMECRKKACSALENDMGACRACLVGLLNSDTPTTPASNAVSTDRSRLEARIRKLESQVIENDSAAGRERADLLRQVEAYRIETEFLRDRLSKLNESDSETRKSMHSQKNLRPSMPHSNIVSVLSKQWEERTGGVHGGIMTENDKNHLLANSTNSSRRALAFNPRHRRSRSAGRVDERWLEHQETNAVPSGTVFTPTLKRRKSVTQLELKDTKKASNYLLHHQEATPDGNLETKLFKGSIIPTAGGGSAVIFDDVEELKQVSPPCTNYSTPCKTTKKKSDSVTTKVDINPRRSTKRSRSSTRSQASSTGSVNTVCSGESEKTTSSGYRPFSPVPRLGLGKQFDGELHARCQIGIHSGGGISGGGSGVGMRARNSNSRKRSKY